MEKHNSNTVWMVRDARGLTSNEKVFLFVVASRGVLKTTRETALEDMGFKKDTFYRTQKTLVEKELLIVSPGQYNPVSGKRDHTWYSINDSVLATHDSQSEKEDSQYEKDDSQSEKEDSQYEKDDSQKPDNKGNREVNREGNREGNKAATPQEAKEDAQPKVDRSLFVETTSAASSLVETTGKDDSVSENRVAEQERKNREAIEKRRAQKARLGY